MEDQNITPRKPYEFQNSMLRWETICALCYLVFHVALIPLLLRWLVILWPGISAVDPILIEVVYAGVGFVFVLAVLGGFLRRGFYTLCDNWRGVLLSLVAAYILYIMLIWGMQLALMALGDPELGQSPNNEYIGELLARDYNKIYALTVFLIPVLEECLFRGGLFGSLYKYGRWTAYIITVLVFSLIHIWQYAVTASDWTYLIYLLGYIPPSVALCYAYEKSGSIWTPIFFHMALNAISVSAMK